MDEVTRRHLGYDVIGDVTVSTVYLAVDLALPGEPPLHYETMIFGGEYDDYQRRYASEAEAEAGHVLAVAMVRASRGGN